MQKRAEPFVVVALLLLIRQPKYRTDRTSDRCAHHRYADEEHLQMAMNCLLLSAAAAFAPAPRLQAFAPARPPARLHAEPLSARPGQAAVPPPATTPADEAQITALRRRVRQKIETGAAAARAFLVSEKGQYFWGAVLFFVMPALLRVAAGGLVAPSPPRRRPLPALNVVWNHGEALTTSWSQGEPLKLVWRKGAYVWHLIRPAGRKPYLYLAGAP